MSMPNDDFYDSLGPFPEAGEDETDLSLYGRVRSLLQYTAAQITDGAIQDELDLQFLLMQSTCVNLPTYATLLQNYPLLFPLAMARLTASKLRIRLPKLSSVGELTSYGRGSARVSFSSTKTTTGKSPEDQWMDEAIKLLMQIPEFRLCENEKNSGGGVIMAVRGSYSEVSWPRDHPSGVIRPLPEMETSFD